MLPGFPSRVAKIEMVSRRIVEVDGALDEPHAEHAGVEIEILLRIAGDRRDMMNAGRDKHQGFISCCIPETNPV